MEHSKLGGATSKLPPWLVEGGAGNLW